MAEPNLSESAWQRAKHDAEGIYKTATFGVALAIMELLAIPAAVLGTVGQKDTAVQVVVPILAGALALALAFIVVLIVQLTAAPVRQRDELRSAWNVLEPIQPVDVGLTLRNERRKGDDLVKSLSVGLGYTTADEEAAEEWTSGVIEFLSSHGDANAAQQFIEASRGEDGFTRQIQARVQTLDQIIERLG